ncbi:DUF5694 domain-containing protein [Massilia sp. TS11]|uniref:DUF5694 domain-containing protein n=1 Tax=Massilia sp. TS11 TaxID=2908003 RepID=UPI001EDC6F0C|nr:DUF5694 domain-containing protein [Massilia sp. TS11]MCG2583158.1 DUF5694 domain-containing protein [Massilia sp. TS11]
MRLPCFALAALVSNLAMAQVDFAALSKDMPGPRTQVAVLGTVHLSGMPKTFRPDSLAPVLDRLAAFKPDIIAIEAISGEGCDVLSRHASVYPTMAKDYCTDPGPAQQALGLDLPQAIAEANKMLKTWPAQPTPAERRRLAAVFIAANERASALTQWLQLPAAERKAAPELPAVLVEALQKMETRQNENFLIGAALAARLGLARVIAMDDHTGDGTEIADEEAFGNAIQAAWASGRPLAEAMLKQEAALKAGQDMLALYRFENQPELQRISSSVDFGSNLRDKSPQHFGRQYVAGWEVRNLRMAANIQASYRFKPGARVLTIVGASHKAWLERILGLGQGVDIVDVQTILR